MRAVCLFVLAALASQPLFANEAFERLKAKYKALQSGQTTLPSLTSPSSPQKVESTIRNTELSGTIPAGEELILGVRLGQLTLGQVFGFKTESSAKLSLTELAQAFDFAITTDLESGSASGWIRTPEKRFQLSQADDGSWLVEVDGVSTTINHASIDLDDDFYVDLALYEQWFDVNFTVDYGLLVLKTTSNTPLPIEEKLAREKRAQNAYQGKKEARAPLQEHDYQPLSKPLLDIQASINAGQDIDTSHSLSILGANDVAYFNTQYYLAFDDDNEISSARLSANRYSNEADLLGFMRATTLEFGDIRTTQINDLQPSNTYLGVRISNTPLSYSGGNSINLVGNIQAGWDVEVYRNQLLISSQFDVIGGQYEFQNVPLVFGYNEIELVFYGPQGQVSSETRDYYVSSTGQTAGDFVYDITLVDEGERLFDQSSLNDSEDRGLSTLIRADYGLTNWWSINIGNQIHHEPGFEQYDQQSFGSEISLFGKALLSADILDQDNGDYERRYQFDTSLGSQSLSFIHRDSQQTDDEDITTAFKSEELRLSGSVPSLKLSYQQSIEKITPESEDSYLRLNNQIGTSVANNYLSNSLIWSNQDGDSLTGDWQLQRYWNDYFVRIGNDYSLSPEFDINSFFAEISGEMTDNTTGRIRFLYDLENQASETAFVASWQPNEFSITSNLTYNSNNGWRATLLGRVGIGLSQDDNAFFSRTSVSSLGTLSARVYLDNNHNNRFDLGDRPLQDVEVKSVQSYRKANTNSQGIAVITSLPGYQQTDIAIDLSTQKEGYLIRADEGVSIIPRPGSLQTLDIPVVRSLEVEGYIQELQQNGNLSNKSRVPVQLKDPSGKVVKEVISEFDGYFLITDIVPKAYFLEIDPNYLKNFSYQQATRIALSGEEYGSLAGQNLTLRKAFEVHGFSAQLATFNRLESLRSYWKILSKRLPKLVKSRYFYEQNESGYQLYVGFSEDQKDAEDICSQLKKQDVACSVKDIVRR